MPCKKSTTARSLLTYKILGTLYVFLAGLWAIISNAGVMGTVGPSEWLRRKHYKVTLPPSLTLPTPSTSLSLLLCLCLSVFLFLSNSLNPISIIYIFFCAIPFLSFFLCLGLFLFHLPSFPGGAEAQSAERATPGEEVVVRSPLWPPAPYWLGRCQHNVTS